MSKLVELLGKTNLYSRLNTIKANPADANGKTYSVRKQSDDTAAVPETKDRDGKVTQEAKPSTRQSNAINAFSDTYQTGFNVYKNSIAPTPATFRKADTSNATDFTGKFDLSAQTAVNTTVAENEYFRNVADTNMTKYGTYTLHKNTYNSKYSATFTNAAGVLYSTNLP